MPMKLLSTDDFRAAAKDGQQPDGMLFKFSTEDPVTVDGAARTKRFVFSDATVDHSDDSIDPKGWDLSVFNRNPVALFSHMSWDPPIGRAKSVQLQGDKLVGDIEFATADVYEFADTIFRLVDGGFLKAVSVGFLPKDWGFSSDKDRPYGIDFKKQSLLEISVCPVPCNPNALAEARSLGVDTRPLVDWAEKVLDSGDTVFLPRKDIETLRSQAKGAAPVRYYLQSDSSVSDKQAARIGVDFKAWLADPGAALILSKGVTLKSTAGAQAEPDAPPQEEVIVEGEGGDEVVDVVAGLLERALTATETQKITDALQVSIAKAGRRISASNKEKLQAAIDMSSAHRDAMTECIKGVMGSDDGDEDDPDNDFDDGDTTDGLPPGAVVPEDADKHLSPEERRIKEARALRESLTTND